MDVALPYSRRLKTNRSAEMANFSVKRFSLERHASFISIQCLNAPFSSVKVTRVSLVSATRIAARVAGDANSMHLPAAKRGALHLGK